MQQITLYYTENLKYLKLGDYVRYFEQESIDEMLVCIKNQETPVKIRTTKEYLIPHKLSDKSKVIYTYEEIEEEKIFDYEKVQQDAKNDVSYALYPVNEKYQNLLGKAIYFCKDKAMQLFLVKEKDICSFMYSDMSELKNNILQRNEIGYLLTLKMSFTDTEIEQLLATQEGK